MHLNRRNPHGPPSWLPSRGPACRPLHFCVFFSFLMAWPLVFKSVLNLVTQHSKIPWNVLKFRAL